MIKIFEEENQKIYFKESAVLNKIKALSESEQKGFPLSLSEILGKNRSEIVMTLLGKNLRNVLKACKDGVFSRPTVYQIMIQLVSKLLIILF